MFYAWFGIALWMAGKAKDSYEYLSSGLELGEKSGNQKVVGYTCTWLPFACAELGLLDEGIGFGEKAQKIAESFPSDQYLFFKSLAGLSYIKWMKGETKKVFESAKLLLDYGARNSNSRSRVFGHWYNSFGHYMSGDMESSRKNSEKAYEVALDPFYAQFPKLTIGMAHLLGGRFQEAEDVLQSVLNFCDKRAMGQVSDLAYLFLSTTLIAKGHMRQGLGILEKAQQTLIRNQRRVWYGVSEHIFGQVYSQIVTGPKPAFSIMAKNIGFLVKNVPFASKKAEEHFNKAIEVIKEVEAKSLLGPVYLDLGLFYKDRKKTGQARECILEAVNIFQECEAEVWLKHANAALDSLA